MSRLKILRSYDFKIVVLNSPYDSLQSDLAKSLFSSFIDLKLRGYGCEYPYGVMPIDTTDFIATHIGVFQHQGNDLRPIAAYKSISERKCAIHGVQFSGLQVPASSGAQEVARFVEGLIQSSRDRNSYLTYEGGWTIDPEIRKDPGLVAEVHRLSTTMHVSQHLLNGPMDSICCGLLRFKTDRIMRGWGYAPITVDGKVLPAFAQASLKGEMVQMHYTSQFSEEALKIAETYRDVWNSRIEIGESKMLDVGIEKKAA